MNVRRPFYRAAHRVGALALLAGLGLSAHAEIQLSHFPPNPGVLPGGGWQFTSGTTFGNPVGPRQWTNGVYGARTIDAMSLATRGGALTVTAQSTMTWRAVGGAAARCLSLSAPVCAAGSAAALLYEGYRVYAADGGGLLADPGTPPVQVDNYSCTVGNYSGTGTTPLGACEKAAQNRNAAIAPTTIAHRFVLQSQTANSFEYATYIRVNGGAESQSSSSTAMKSGTTSGCPASIDPGNSAYNVPAGKPVGPDGKCPTARYNWAPISPEVAADTKLPAQPNGAIGQQAAQDAIASGQAIPATVTTQGPSSINGPSVQGTTTGPSGTTTTTKTPTYTFNYGGDTITYGPTTTTTTITNNEGTTTTTETEQETPTDQCERYPDSLGCIKMGDAPEETVPVRAATMTYTAETPGLPSGCPGDVVLFDGQTFSYAHACTAAERMRPLVIAAAGITASLMMVFALRGQ